MDDRRQCHHLSSIVYRPAKPSSIVHMNNWLEIISIALWLLGLALILGVTSYSDYRRSQARLPAKMTWRMVIRNGWTFLGALLFCAGMMLDSGSLLEGAVWVLPAVFI